MSAQGKWRVAGMRQGRYEVLELYERGERVVAAFECETDARAVVAAHNAQCEAEPEEQWQPVAGYEGSYEVSNRGRVRNARSGFLMNGTFCDGYLKVHLRAHCSRFFYIHTLVAMAFLGERPEGKQINHKDGNRLNNDVKNLEYVFQRENINHGLRHISVKGVRKRGSKYTAQVQINKTQKHLGTFDTEAEARAAYLGAIIAVGEETYG